MCCSSLLFSWEFCGTEVSYRYYLVGSSAGLKCPTILHDFPVQKVGTERVPKAQIYLHKKTITSKQLVKWRRIYSHIWKMGTKIVPTLYVEPLIKRAQIWWIYIYMLSKRKQPFCIQLFYMTSSCTLLIYIEESDVIW